VRIGAVLLILGMAASPLAGQLRSGTDAGRALELERRGDHTGAAQLWRTVLAQHPDDLPALLGLERALTPQNRLIEMIPLVQAAARVAPSAGVWGVAIRVWTAASSPDSARAAVEKWSALEPTSDAPFQEWGLAAMSQRDRATARAAYELGRTRLGQPNTLAAELGQIAALDANYPLAAREWTLALETTPGYRPSALAVLGQIAPADRPALLEALRANGSPQADRLAAGLMARWGDPLGAVRRLLASADARAPEQRATLQELFDDLRGTATPDLNHARGILLEAIAEREQGARRSQRRLQAAQAYADAGDQAAARRMLGVLAQDPDATPSLAAGATSTLVTVLVDEGKLDEADRRFSELRGALNPEESQRMSLRLASGWVRAGRLGRADTLIAADSSVEALAVRGRIQLYRGDLAGGAALLRNAGPFTGDRSAATGRVGILGLLQVFAADSSPELGSALLKLERGDSAGAAKDLEAIAATVEPEKGGSELMLLAGRLRSGLRQSSEAERVFRAVMSSPAPASAAAAAFALAELQLRNGKRPEAIATLEQMLLAHPTSAVIPQARRLLDVARGAVPPV
jgi:hypothetical protein